MNFLLSLLVIFLVAISCKSKPAEIKQSKYYVFIDGVEQTDRGLEDVQLIDTIYTVDDNSAINIGINNYYERVVKVAVQKQEPAPVTPYLVEARGWAVLDERGENVKDRVSAAFVDSSNTKAVERATAKINNSRLQ